MDFHFLVMENSWKINVEKRGAPCSNLQWFISGRPLEKPTLTWSDSKKETNACDGDSSGSSSSSNSSRCSLDALRFKPRMLHFSACLKFLIELFTPGLTDSHTYTHTEL